MGQKIRSGGRHGRQERNFQFWEKTLFQLIPHRIPAAAAGGIDAPKLVVNFNPTALNVSWDRIYNASSTTVSVTPPNSTTPVTKSVTYPTSAVTFLPTDFQLS